MSNGEASEAKVPGGPPAVPGLTVAAVARRLGVAPATLRTWDRRYGLGPGEHAAGAHRRYSPTDVARLEAMRRLVNSGVPPADAARTAMSIEIDQGVDGRALQAMGLPLDEEPTSVPSPSLDFEALEAEAETRSRAGGGQVIPLPGGSAGARGLARAALSLDSPGCFRIIDRAIAKDGVIHTWDHLVAPVLIGIGERWERLSSGVEVEHVLSEALVGAFSARTAALEEPLNSRPILLASAPEDLHTLPLFAVAAALAEQRIAARMIGARTPVEALRSAIRRTGPAAVMIWSQIPSFQAQSMLSELPELRPAPLVVLGGGGWAEAPEGMVHVADLHSAVTQLARAVN